MTSRSPKRPFSGDFEAELEVGPDGTIWVLGAESAGDRVLFAWWDGAGWNTADPGPVPGVGADLTIDATGTVWVGPVTWFDGSAFHSLELPVSDDNTDPALVSAAHAPDGTVWVVMVDRSETGNQACPTYCEGEPDGLYIIDPRLAATKP